MIKKIISNICSIFSVAVFCYLLIILGVIMYFNSPNSFHQTDKKFIIEKGLTFREVVEKLHQEKIVKNPSGFLYLSQLIKGTDPKVRYGEYFFEKNISYYKILHKMIRGNIFFRKVTAAEGLTTNSILKIIDSSAGLIGQIPDNVKEGTLLPETYFYSYNDTKFSIVKRMQESMNKNLDELWEKRDLSTPIKSKQEAIILASIVEKETAIASERPLVASVFTNRLIKGMKLQSDPTIIYSFTQGDKSLERPIRMSDIRNNSKFNTYYIYGLPPAPICNPGIESIKAVLNPPKTNFLYFVASQRGSHEFATNLTDHNINVAKYRAIQAQRAQAKLESINSQIGNENTEVKNIEQ